MITTKQIIVKEIKKIVKDLTNQDIVPALEHPKDERHGDYSTNIALTLFAKLKAKSQKSKVGRPIDLAREIAKILNTSYLIPNTLSRIEVVAPGFINFWLSEDYLTALMIPIIRVKDGYGRSELLANKKIMVEFTDPNPFKEFHIGHLYSNIVGESLSRLLESQGAEVWRVCYQGDVGLHVAKALYAVLSSKFKVQSSKLEKESLINKIKTLGQAYALGVKAYEEDESAKKEIEKINKEVYEENSSIMEIYKKGRAWSLEYFDSIYKRLGTKFKRFYFESEAGKIGLEIVKKNIGKVFKKSDGAIIFPGEKYGLHNRVFINSLGLPTYEAKDLGLAATKYKDFPYDLSIIITATEQSDYFKVVLKALSLIEPDLARKTKHISHGVVRLPIGKMSSRTGTIITGEWILDEAKKRIRERYKEMDDMVGEMVAVGAVKYALLKSGIGKDLSFDFDESISLEGNSGPYLQYTFARTRSVLAKVKSHPDKVGTKVKSDWKFDPTSWRMKLEIEESSLLKSLHRFPEVVGEAAEQFAPNLLCNYLFDLAQKFNLFYQKHKIIESENREFRLALTQAVGQIIKNGLDLLGIKAPERM
jgi:arginyl-tRNA synthetase